MGRRRKPDTIGTQLNEQAAQVLPFRSLARADWADTSHTLNEGDDGGIMMNSQDQPVADQSDQPDYAARTWKTMLANERFSHVRCLSEHWIILLEYSRDPAQPMFSGCSLTPGGFADLMVADAALWEIPPLMQIRLIQRMNRMENTGFDASIGPSLPVTQQFLYSSFATRMIHAPRDHRTWYRWASGQLVAQVTQSGEFVFLCAAAQCASENDHTVFWRLRPELLRYQAVIRPLHGLVQQRTLDNLLMGGEH